jgi:hypothetical protein
MFNLDHRPHQINGQHFDNAFCCYFRDIKTTIIVYPPQSAYKRTKICVHALSDKCLPLAAQISIISCTVQYCILERHDQWTEGSSQEVNLRQNGHRLHWRMLLKMKVYSGSTANMYKEGHHRHTQT